MAAEEPGTITLEFTNKLGGSPKPVLQVHTSQVSAAATTYPVGVNRSAMQNMAELLSTGIKSATEGRLRVVFTSDAADTIESEESEIHIPVLLIDKLTSRVISKMLTFQNITGFTTAGTVDIVCAANVPVEVAYYDVPSGMMLAFNPLGKLHCYIGDDT